MLFYKAVIMLPLLAAASNDILFDTSGATPFYDNYCDDCYEAVNLNYTYGFFDENYSTVYVGSNGYMTFDQGYTWADTSGTSPTIMLAPYWSDIDQSTNYNNAEISFEETQDSEILAEAKKAIVEGIFPGCGDLFEPTSLFIATWKNVASYCEWYYNYDDAVDIFDYYYCYYYDRSQSYPDDYADYIDESFYSYGDNCYSTGTDVWYADGPFTHNDDIYSYYNDNVDHADVSIVDMTDAFSHTRWYDGYDWNPDYIDQYIDEYDISYLVTHDYSDDKKRDANGRHGRPNKQQKPPKPDVEAEGKSHNIVEENTFQVILATDGCDTFAIINFGDIQWTSCNGENEMVFTAGDLGSFYVNPEIQLDSDTNVNQRGRWVYKISESRIRGPGCDIIST